ncbi:MAG: efflux RND transporter periplasmic adaptor subunit [Acidobacteriota bacterium]|nr:efflux RND transporter periplasmic adaptor subunit [Acidobacteriota bacterium]
MEDPVIQKTIAENPAQWTATASTPQPHNSAQEEEIARRRPRRGSVLIGGIVLAIAFGAAVFYGVRSRSDAQHDLKVATLRAAVPTVTVVHPILGSKAQEVVLPGNTMAFIDTSIYARTNGYLKKWFVDIGARVRAGQLLAIIDAPEVDQQLQQGQADLKSTMANEQLAESTNVRWQGLVAKHAVSQQEADQVASDFAAKQAATAASQANVRRLEQLQSYERVTAPFDGIITARSTDVGALINAGSAAEPRELFHLAQVGKLRVFVAVPEVYADSVQDGGQVDITTDADPGHVIKGTVTRNSNAISQASRTLNVEVDVDNAGGGLLPGAYVFVHMKLPAAANTVTIPSNALLFRAQGLQVGVVRDGRAQLVNITVGHDFGSSVEVTSGLNANDCVILDPSDSLVSGMPVEVGSAADSGPNQ